ncbi:hypothetical protein CRUP_004533 [Coryphaenoides rupestris]|nr:hypothetical protein CRUP_004533 [Coryphaenoides rupestris]
MTNRQTAYLSDVGEQVVGDALGILSDEAADGLVQPPTGCCSSMGSRWGSPYTVAELLNTRNTGSMVNVIGDFTRRVRGEAESNQEATPAPCARAPRIVRGPKHTSNPVGSGVVLGCEVTAYPLPSVTWRKRGSNYVLPGDRPRISVQVEGLQLADAGVYSCISQNALGETSATARLTVFRREEAIVKEAVVNTVDQMGRISHRIPDRGTCSLQSIQASIKHARITEYDQAKKNIGVEF